MNIEILKAEEKHLVSIVEFQLKMALETESLELDKSILKKGVNAVFDNPKLAQYYVAQEEGKVVASLMITYEWSDWRNSMVWWIQSVYVIPEYRRKGIFSKFYQFIKEKVEKLEEVGGIRLYVDKTNLPAQKTYHAIGMNGEHYQLFEWMK